MGRGPETARSSSRCDFVSAPGPVSVYGLRSTAYGLRSTAYENHVYFLTLDAYIIDTLLADLVGHDRQPSAFLVYLYLWRRTHGAGRPRVQISLADLADATGLSKRSVQDALGTLSRAEARKHRSREHHRRAEVHRHGFHWWTGLGVPCSICCSRPSTTVKCPAIHIA